MSMTHGRLKPMIWQMGYQVVQEISQTFVDPVMWNASVPIIF